MERLMVTIAVWDYSEHPTCASEMEDILFEYGFPEYIEFRQFLYPADSHFTEIKNKSIRKVYSENKDFNFIVIGITQYIERHK